MMTTKIFPRQWCLLYYTIWKVLCLTLIIHQDFVFFLVIGKNIILFCIPGAFIPTCSMWHVPCFVEKAEGWKGKGVENKFQHKCEWLICDEQMVKDIYKQQEDQISGRWFYKVNLCIGAWTRFVKERTTNQIPKVCTCLQ